MQGSIAEAASAAGEAPPRDAAGNAAVRPQRPLGAGGKRIRPGEPRGQKATGQLRAHRVSSAQLMCIFMSTRADGAYVSNSLWKLHLQLISPESQIWYTEPRV